MLRVAWWLGVLSMGGCTLAARGLPSEVVVTGADGAASDGDTSAPAQVCPDGGYKSTAAGPLTPCVCLGAWSASHPDELALATVTNNPTGSMTPATFSLTADCALQVSDANCQKQTTLSAENCSTLKRALTTDALFATLRDPAPCDSSYSQIIAIQLRSGEVMTKNFECASPMLLDAFQYCYKELMSQYYPCR